MEIMKPLLTKQFTGSSYKEAYLKANKWVASNIISKYDKAEVKYEKKVNSDWDLVMEVTIYVRVNAEVLSDRHCKICRQIKDSKFNYKGYDKLNCDECSMRGYLNRAKDELTKLAKMRKEELK